MNTTANIISKAMYYSRWMLVVFYGGLIASLFVFGLFFLKKLYKIAIGVGGMDSSDMILSMLSMLDMSLIAGLIVMVVISGYDAFVAKFRLSEDASTLNDLVNVSSGAIKLKISMTIILISAIYILETLMDFQKFTVTEIAWALGIHITLALTGLILAVIEKLSGHHH
ncbi:MAG: YqhA family protein [Rhodospirillaceae bacterium]